ncbi:hypothetical protein AVEN_199786-1, partial [Araneus ventricosus]
MGLLRVKSCVVAKSTPVELPAQVSSSSSDHPGSKLRGEFQNSPSVASKRDANITKQISRKSWCWQ